MNRREYFEDLAGRWDRIYEAEKVRPLLREGLRHFGMGAKEQVVDLGCGTGVLLKCLLEHLGPAGLVQAVDFSPRMIERARRKFPDPRVRFLLADAVEIPLAPNSVDRVICFSAWPHFPDPDAVLREMLRILKPGGQLHVWHTDSRDKINEIHRSAHPAVSADMLEDAGRLSERMCRARLLVLERRDDDRAYLVTGRKEAER